MTGCWLFHRWSTWKTFEEREMSVVYWIVRQKRTCVKCGKVQLREVLI